MSKCLPLITFATLDRQTWQHKSKCPSVLSFVTFPTQDHQTGKKHLCPETTFSVLASSSAHNSHHHGGRILQSVIIITAGFISETA